MKVWKGHPLLSAMSEKKILLVHAQQEQGRQLFSSFMSCLAFPHIHYCYLIIILQSPTTKGNLIAVTNQAEFENLRYVVDAIVVQKSWQNLNGETKPWWTGLEGETASKCNIVCMFKHLIDLFYV